MRHLAKLGAAASAAVLVAGCGGATNVLQGKSAAQIVKLAGTQLAGKSFRMTLHGKVSFDTSGLQGVPADAMGSLDSAMKNLTIEGTADVQDTRHLRLNVTLQPLLDKPIVVVLYDGHAYVSENGGKSFSDAGQLNLQGLPVSPADIISQLGDAVGAKDLGTTTHNGTRVEHLHATLSADSLEKMLDRFGSGQMQQLGGLIKQVLTVKDGNLDLYVRTQDGLLDATQSTGQFSIDLGKLMGMLMQAFGGQLPAGADASQVGGTMTLTENVATEYGDYGARISIAKPTVDPTAPKLPSGGLFGNLGG